MNLPPISNEYRPAIQSELQTQLEKADQQNFKLDQDNFFTTGSICLQSDNGKWWQVTVSDAGALSTSELTGTQIDSDGRPVIASTNPYYVAP